MKNMSWICCVFLATCHLLDIYSVKETFANNASYISLSSQIARRKQLEIVANNVANVNTIGFEQDNTVFQSVDVQQNSRDKNAFVQIGRTYRNNDQGALKITNRPTDMAIGGEGYFKLVTPRGIRYTLDGTMLVNNQGVLVNAAGYPFLSVDNDVMVVPEEYQSINIASDGVVFIDQEEVAQVGVFALESPDSIRKEGGNLYAVTGADRLMTEFTIITGALRASNVNPTVAMTQMIEVQRSHSITTDLMSNIHDTENSVIQKVTK